MTTKNVTDESFEAEVLKANLPTLVDFWAEWCGPCKQISPILQELAEDFQEKVLIAKVNIDENPEIPSKYGIMSIPTLILFKNGELIATQIGLVEKKTLSTWLDENI